MTVQKKKSKSKSKSKSKKQAAKSKIKKNIEVVSAELSPQEKYQNITSQAESNCTELIELSERTSKSFAFFEDIIASLCIIKEKNDKSTDFLFNRYKSLEKRGVRGIYFGGDIIDGQDIIDEHLNLGTDWADLNSFMHLMRNHLLVSDMSIEEIFLFCLTMGSKILARDHTNKYKLMTFEKNYDLKMLSSMASYLLNSKLAQDNSLHLVDNMYCAQLKFKSFLGSYLSLDIENAELMFKVILPSDEDWNKDPNNKLECQSRVMAALRVYSDLVVFWGGQLSKLNNDDSIALIRFLDSYAASVFVEHVSRGGVICEDSLNRIVDTLIEMSSYCSEYWLEKLNKKKSLLVKYISEDNNLTVPKKSNQLGILKKDLTSFMTCFECYFKIRDCILHSYMVKISSFVPQENSEVSKILSLHKQKLNCAFKGKSLPIPFSPSVRIGNEEVTLSGVNFDKIIKKLHPFKLLDRVMDAIELNKPIISHSKEKGVADLNTYNTPLIKPKPKTKAAKTSSHKKILSSTQSHIPKKKDKEDKHDCLQDLYNKYASNKHCLYELHVKYNEFVAQGMRAAIRGKINLANEFMSKAKNNLSKLEIDSQKVSLILQIHIMIDSAELKIFGYFLDSKKIEIKSAHKDSFSKEDLEGLSELYSSRYNKMKQAFSEADEINSRIGLLECCESIDIDELLTKSEMIRTNVKSMVNMYEKEFKNKKSAEIALNKMKQDREKVLKTMGKDAWSNNPNPRNQHASKILRLKSAIKTHEIIEKADKKNDKPISESLKKPTLLTVTDNSVNRTLIPIINSGIKFYLFGGSLLKLTKGQPIDYGQDLDIITNASEIKLNELGFSKNKYIENLYTIKSPGCLHVDCSYNQAVSTGIPNNLSIFGSKVPDFTVASLIASLTPLNPNVLVFEIYDPSGRGLIDQKNNTLSLVDTCLFNDPVQALRAIKYISNGFNPDKNLQKKLKDCNFNISVEKKSHLIAVFSQQYRQAHYKDTLDEYINILHSYKDCVLKNLFGDDPFISLAIGTRESAVCLVKEKWNSHQDQKSYAMSLYRYGILDVIFNFKGIPSDLDELTKVINNTNEQTYVLKLH